MVEGAEFIIWEGAEWVELRLEEEGLACGGEVVMSVQIRTQTHDEFTNKHEQKQLP